VRRTARRVRVPVLVGVAIVVAVVFLGLFPTRSYVAQRRAIAAEQEKVVVLRTENDRLAARVARLHTDAEIERLAREQYNLVKPGEEAYAILPGPADPPGDIEAAVPAAHHRRGQPSRPAFWSRVWDHMTFWN
jgi:cell division protein FtsB